MDAKMTADLLKNHLTIEEIIDFVSFESINEESLRLASRVNGHIRECEECRRAVSAFGEVYEELCRIYGVGEAKETVYCIMNDGELEAVEQKELAAVLRGIKEGLLEGN